MMFFRFQTTYLSFKKYITNNFEGQIDTGKMAFELIND